ncbi:MAG TPA: hypothetical protein VKR56_13600 [Candidatus Cybelea sp.]|nr:hypothetical protein [Candidatus Cybelea sp.]
MIRFLRIPLLVVATVLTVTACNGKSSSNASDQSNATTSAQSTPAPVFTPRPPTPNSVYGAPVFPGAIVEPAKTVNLQGTQSTVLTVDDSFDEVHAWYQEHIQTELSHTTGAMTGAVFVVGTGKNQVKVTLAPSDPSDTIITYMRGPM